MRHDGAAMRELWTRCEELRLTLWARAEAKEAAARSRLAAAQSDGRKTRLGAKRRQTSETPHPQGWLEERLVAADRNLCFLMQLEVDRLAAAVHLLHDWFGATLEPIGDPVPTPEDPKAKKPKDEPPPPRLVSPIDIFAQEVKVADPKAKKDPKAKDEPQEPVDQLEASAALALAAARRWLPPAAPFADRPDASPLLRVAVHAQAGLAEARVLRLKARGEALRGELRADAEHVMAELGCWIEERAMAELEAADEAVAVARRAVAAHEAIAADWRLDGTTLAAHQHRRLVPSPGPSPEPTLTHIDSRRLNHTQATGLVRSLHVAAEAEALGGDVLSIDTLVDTLMRLAANEADLPEQWTGLAASRFVEVCAELDPEDCGFVALARAAEYLKSWG